MHAMEAKSIKFALALAILLVFLAGESTASFKDCYPPCYSGCKRGRQKFKTIVCAAECFAICVLKRTSNVNINCGLACAKSSCSHLDPGKKEMEACLQSCHKSCA